MRKNYNAKQSLFLILSFCLLVICGTSLATSSKGLKEEKRELLFFGFDVEPVMPFQLVIEEPSQFDHTLILEQDNSENPVKIIRTHNSGGYNAMITSNGKLFVTGFSDSAQLFIETCGDIYERPYYIKSLQKFEPIRDVAITKTAMSFIDKDYKIWFMVPMFTTTREIIQVLGYDVNTMGRIIQIDANSYSFVAITDTGFLLSWSIGEFQVLFNSTYEIVKISVGDEHNLALSKDGKVYCWGVNAEGACGFTREEQQVINSPILITSLLNETIVDITASLTYSLVLTNTNQLFAFGSNKNGMFNDVNGTYQIYYAHNNVKDFYPFLNNATMRSIESAGTQISIVDSYNNIYNFGIKIDDVHKSLQTIRFTQIFNNFNTSNQIIKSLEMGDEYGIVLLQSGYVYGYGRNRYSQLGLGEKCFRCTPYEIGSKLGIDTTDLQVSSGGISFLVKEGELILKGWGLQSGMGIGNSSNQDAFDITKPVSVLSDKLSINDPIKSFDFSRVSYVLLNSGSTYYWGYNNNYALGTNTTAGNVFEPFLAFTNRWQMVSSSRKNSCAKEIDSNRVFCWGYKGGLGDNVTYPKTINSVYEPKLVAFGSPVPNIIKIELGEGSAVALSDKGQVFTWGDNLYYTIGDGTQNPRKYPYHLKELDDKNIVEIHAFELFCVALSSDGKVYQWGELSRWRSDTYKFFATTPTLLNIPRNRKIKKVAGKQTFVIFISEFDEIIYTHYKIPDFRFLETSKHFKLIDISAKGEVALIYAQTDQCKLGYSNYPNCDTYECFGYQFNDVNVCSKGNGKCVAPDYCECSYGWEGNNCSTPYYVCNSTRMDDINVCSGRGECVGMDKCNCTNNGYVGKYCENIACNGIISTDDNVCSGHGLCIGPNNCSCTIDGYFGDNCSEFKCFGYLSTDSKACSGHGTCKSPNHCACDSSIYFGEQCERIITKSSSSVIIHRDDAGLIVGVLFGIITVIVFATLGIVAGIYFYKRYEKARGTELEHLALNNSL